MTANDDAPTGPEEMMDAGFDFEFAYDNETFSNRVLHIEVVGSDQAAAPAVSGAEAPSRKRSREEAEAQVVNGESINSSGNVIGTPILRVKNIKVNSAILAAKSPFFFKLFTNGMKESDQRQATLRIADSEENAFMELLRFMYSGKLKPTIESTLLVDILMIADKFEVVSCMKLCGKWLIDQPMTTESAVLCLGLPNFIPVAVAVKEAAKKSLAARYKDFCLREFQDELMRIPLDGIVAILSRNDLGVVHEVAVYDFLLRWTFTRYPSSEERCKILSSRLLPLVPRMHGMIINNVMEIDKTSCEINLKVDRNLCSELFLTRSAYCQQFRFVGQGYFLSAHCNRMDSSNSFGLLLEMIEDKVPVKGTIEYKFEAKTRPSLEYVTRYEYTCTDSREDVECKDLFGIPWSEFTADDCPFFIDDILHLRVRMKMTQQKPS